MHLPVSRPYFGLWYTIILTGWFCVVCGNTFYHTGSILLLQTGLLQIPTENSSSLLEDAVSDSYQNLRRQSPDMSTQDNALWHARELAGISMSNSSQ